jgi:hypothetical protein
MFGDPYGGYDCDLCGAPGCTCNCLELLREFLERSKLYHPVEPQAEPVIERPSLWQKVKRWFMG